MITLKRGSSSKGRRKYERRTGEKIVSNYPSQDDLLEDKLRLKKLRKEHKKKCEEGTLRKFRKENN